MNEMNTKTEHEPQLNGLRKLLNKLLFDTESKPGAFVNNLMLILILIAVTASMLNTVDQIHQSWGNWIGPLEYSLLITFAIEFLLRLYAARNRLHYIKSFNGLVDMATVLPLLLTGDTFVIVRLLRLVRVIRVAISFPVVRALFASLKGSIKLLFGVLATIGLISVMVGNLIHIIEPETFANAFEGIWWALVTMSTVGYGDFVPQSVVGKAIASVLIMSGICMFAMVTAVISVKVGRMINNSGTCTHCNHSITQDHPFCPHCGAHQLSGEVAVQPEISISPNTPDDL